MLRLQARIFQNLPRWTRGFHRDVAPTTTHATNSSLIPASSELASKWTFQFAQQLSSPQAPLYRRPAGNKIIEDLPLRNIIIESPRNTMINEIKDIVKNENLIRTPSANTSDEIIQAARMIVIRQRKMRKHKLRKLRKKMKFEWAKVRQRREMRREKAFQAMLIAQIKEAEKFSAEQYVEEKLKMANETPIPRLWKGKRLPQFIIKEKLGIK